MNDSTTNLKSAKGIARLTRVHRPSEPAVPEPPLRPIRVLTGRERRARSWSIFWGVAILPSLMLTLAATWQLWWPVLEGFLRSPH